MELGDEAAEGSLETPSATGKSSALSGFLVPAFIFSATFAAFWPVLHNGFVNYDDDKVIQGLSGWRGIGWAHLRWMFSHFVVANYAPLSLASYALDHQIWGLDPMGYHLTNLALHGANAVLFYFVCLRLLAWALPQPLAAKKEQLRLAAACSALAFSLHPLRVESVAWISERRDVLSGFFYLWTILLYLRARSPADSKDERVSSLVPCLFVYALSLLSKGMAISLPLTLLLIDIFPLKRLSFAGKTRRGIGQAKVFLEKIPFFVLAIAAGVAGYLGQNQPGYIRPLVQFGFASRLAEAAFGLCFYIWKTIWPVHLMPLYEIPHDIVFWHWPFWACGTVVLALSGALLIGRRRRPGLLNLWLFYVLTLAPVLGFVPFGLQIAADRYTYLACLGWAMASGTGLALALRLGKNWSARFGILAAGGLILLALGRLTWAQCRIWHDSKALWTRVIEFAPQTSTAHGNLGNVYVQEGRLDKALAEYRTALKIKPSNTAALNDYCLALSVKGTPKAASAVCGKAAALNPASAVSRYNFGYALSLAGKLDQAISEYETAARINPHLIQARINLGSALAAKGRQQEALAQYQKAIEINPLDLVSYSEMTQAGRAARLSDSDANANRAMAYYDIGTTLGFQGKLRQANAAFRMAISLRPTFARAHANLGIALARLGRTKEAITEAKRALQIDPKQPAARSLLRELGVSNVPPH